MTNQSPEPSPCEVILLTALPIEFQAVIAHLQQVQEIIHPSGTIYHWGTFSGEHRPWRVAVAEIGMGGLAAAAEAEKAISFFHAQIALFVGVAGGLKDVQRGDVVVATKVYAYEAGKAAQRFEPRPDLGHSSHALEQRARAEAHGKKWLARLQGSCPNPAPQVFIGALAAGEKVLSSKKSSLARLLKRNFGDALAIEMEGHGFLHAVRVNHTVYGLVIRGISDLVDDKAVADASGMQIIAARHAAAFAFQVLAKFTLSTPTSGLGRTPPVILPPHTQSFVGREEELRWLLQQFTDEDSKILGLCGPGGIGKTALAAEALMRLTARHDWPNRFPGGIFYHSFYRFSSLAVAFEEIARFFGEEVGADPHRAALRALSRRRTLLVFDGVEILDDTLPLRELGGRHVALLLSRRQSDTPDPASRRMLSLLSVDQGVALLQQLAGSRAAHQQSVEQLVQHLGGYPLALQLIGSYLSSRQEEVEDYLQWFEQEGLAALHYGSHQAQSIPVLLERTYDSLSENEQQVFMLVGLLAPTPFPLEIMQNILELPERAARQALGSLVNLSVLRRPSLNYEVSHPLVHIFATELLATQASDTMMMWRERLWTTLATHFEQSDPYDVTALSLWQPHVLPLVSANDLTSQQYRRAANLFNKVGCDASTQGKYAEAEPLLKRALAISEQELGASHPDTAISLNNLAALYESQGRYGEGEPLYKRALTISEQQLGPDHPQVAVTLNGLAELYRKQAKYEQAEPLFQRALVIFEQQLGPEHPQVASSLNGLAKISYEQGKQEQAESFFQRALGIREQQLGSDHPQVAHLLNNLAEAYRKQGKRVEAEPLYERALTIMEQQLGPEHPQVAHILNNLAAVCYEQGKYEQAEPLFQRALHLWEQQLGPDHPQVAYALNNLAELSREQGKYEQAEPLYQRALTIFEQQLGAEHNHVAYPLNNLAELYYEQGKYEQAEPLYQRALAIFEQRLGSGHPQVAYPLNGLAKIYREQGKYEQAEPLFLQALHIREQRLGPDHPLVAFPLNNLALLYSRQDKYEQAMQRFQQALDIREQALGSQHPETAETLHDLAQFWEMQGNRQEARSLYTRALKIREQALGAHHPKTMKTRTHLITLLDVMEQNEG